MRLNWVDLLCIGSVALFGAVQFLRSRTNFSQVLYETIAICAAAFGATKLFMPLAELLEVSYVFTYIGLFVVFGSAGIFMAATLNRAAAFGMGTFNYLLGLLLAVVCGWAAAHVLLRGVHIAYAIRNPDVIVAINRSWMASQILRFGAFRELLGVLRIARYNNI